MSQKETTWLDLIPVRVVDPYTTDETFFVDEHDENGNHLEAYEFKTEEQANYFIYLWMNEGADAAIKYDHCLHRSRP